MQKSKNKSHKEKALLKEADDWESGKRGQKSRAATRQEEEAVDQSLGLHMISLRLPTGAVEELKKRAAQRGLKYQPYIRQVLIEHIKGESLEERVAKLEKMAQHPH